MTHTPTCPKMKKEKPTNFHPSKNSKRICAAKEEEDELKDKAKQEIYCVPSTLKEPDTNLYTKQEKKNFATHIY